MKAHVKRTCFSAALSLGFGLSPLAAQNNSDQEDDDPMSGRAWNNPPQLTGFPALFDQHLVILADGQFKPFDSVTLKNVKFWAFYFTASSSPPCSAFTPKLVDFYNQFKPLHPEFELILVDHDPSEDAMLDDMKTNAMPWPAIRFGDIDQVKVNLYCGAALPDLVLVDPTGKVLSDSFQGAKYLGPQKVIDEIKTLLQNP